jgi:hypothetical protein
MDSLRMSRARCYCPILGPRRQRLSEPCSFLIEAKHSAFTDESEFRGEPIEHPVIQFAMPRSGSKVVKGARYMFPKIICACCERAPAHESREPPVAPVIREQMPKTMEMGLDLGP